MGGASFVVSTTTAEGGVASGSGKRRGLASPDPSVGVASLTAVVSAGVSERDGATGGVASLVAMVTTSPFGVSVSGRCSSPI